MRTLIVGGGIGGLTLAAALRQHGLHATVIERADAWAPVGAGIVLGMNAMRILRGLGLQDALLDRGERLAEAAITDAKGAVLSRADFAALEPELGPTVALHRAALHDVLLSAVDRNHLRLSTTLQSLAQNDDTLDVSFANGATETYDLVVGADGIRSQVRELVFGPVEPRYSGYTCWRVVVSFRIPSGRTVEMWGRGRRVGIVAIDADRVYAFFTLNAPHQDAKCAEISLATFRHTYREFGGDVPGILSAIRDERDLIHNDLEEVHVPRWTRNRVALLGDAAHAMTPNMGQGAAMAIEDAYVLADELSRGDAIPTALERYETRRRPRVTEIQQRSWTIGRVAQWQSAPATQLRNALVKLAPDSSTIRALKKMLTAEI